MSYGTLCVAIKTQSLRQSAVSRDKLKPPRAEQRLLGLLFADESLRLGVLPILSAEDYEDLATAAIFRALLELEAEGNPVDFESLTEKIEGDELSSRLLPMLLMSGSLHASNEHYTPEECVHTFRLMKLNHRIEEVKADLAIAEREGDSEKVSSLSNEQIELARRRGALLPKVEAMQSGL